MYVCMCVCTHPSKVDQPPPSLKNAQREEGGSGPSGGRGGCHWDVKQNFKKKVAPGPRVSTARVRAAPSLDRVSSRARVGVVPAAALRGILLVVVLGAPPGLPTQVVPGYNSQRTAQGGDWAGSPTVGRTRAGLSASGLRLPPSRQCVAGTSPDSPRCLDRLR